MSTLPSAIPEYSSSASIVLVCECNFVTLTFSCMVTLYVCNACNTSSQVLNLILTLWQHVMKLLGQQTQDKKCLNSWCCSCVDVSGKLHSPTRLGLPSNSGHLVHTQKVGRTVVSCFGANIERITIKFTPQAIMHVFFK